MEEKSRYYELLVSAVSSSDYFKSMNKGERRELLDYINSELYRKTFERIWKRNFGLECVVKLAVPAITPVVKGANSISAVA